MRVDDTLDALLPLYKNYYNVNTDGCEPPFAAEAVFTSHNEQYYLIKAAKVADININEYVYFAKSGDLSEKDLASLTDTAWERGLSHVVPGYDHRSTDITLYILADNIEEDLIRKIKKTRRYKSWKWGFNGWSNFKLVAIECSSGRAYYNHQGRSLKKLVGNILNVS